jgi:hypothetical protein
MLQEITEQEAKEMVKESPEEQVVIFYEKEKRWYNIKGKSMEEVGGELIKMADNNEFGKPTTE